MTTLVLLMAACGGGDDAGAGEGILSITEAAEASTGDVAVTVRGFIVADTEGVRPCEALAESFPPRWQLSDPH